MKTQELEGKVAVVTGGSSGIGRSIAILFAKEGARVVIADIREESREADTSVVDEIQRATGKTGEAFFHKTDVSSTSELRSLIDATVSRFGRIDVMVNNAGIFMMKPINEVSEEEYDRMMAINVKGVYFGSKFAAEQMLKQGSGGSIINLSSVAGLVGAATATTYCMTKGAVSNFTRALAAELGPRGIRVNSINPGVIETKMTTEDVPIAGQFTAAVPLGRDGKPDEVAECALFLASDRSSFVNGLMLAVDGGYTAV